MQVVASEQEVMSGSVDSKQNLDEADKDLINYMVSSVISLPMQEEERKVKFLSQTIVEQKTITWLLNQFLYSFVFCVFVMTETDGGL